jgi:hypothetical protein
MIKKLSYSFRLQPITMVSNFIVCAKKTKKIFKKHAINFKWHATKSCYLTNLDKHSKCIKQIPFKILLIAEKYFKNIQMSYGHEPNTIQL